MANLGLRLPRIALLWPWMGSSWTHSDIGWAALGCIPSRFQVGRIGKEGSTELEKIVELLEVENKAATVTSTSVDSTNNDNDVADLTTARRSLQKDG